MQKVNIEIVYNYHNDGTTLSNDYFLNGVKISEADAKRIMNMPNGDNDDRFFCFALLVPILLLVVMFSVL